ncbi:MAG: hypothetical protein BAJALOKI1v1_160024 [Promethearchaeota archaeon]|nr:MAG: hypothetical protein BAJALOKI1v1_160024 [Candidatus Lokiarchaeota archaeon]
MLGIRSLKKELTDLNNEMKAVREQLEKLSSQVDTVSLHLTTSMDKISDTLEETNETIRNSLNLTSETINNMSITFSKSLEKALQKVSDFKLQMDIRETILKSLGLKDIIPDFLRKNK